MAHQGGLIGAPLRLVGAGLLAFALLGACLPVGARAETWGSISGKVTEAVTHAPLSGIQVCAFAVNFELLAETEAEHAIGCQKTLAGGEYTIGELEPESYVVGFFVPEGSPINLAQQFYDGKTFESEATPVLVKAGLTTSEIGAELSPGAEISGVVRSSATGAPINEAGVCAVRETTGGTIDDVVCAESEASGAYTVRGLPSGEYKLAFFAAGFAPGWYQGKPTRAEAQVISVLAPNLTAIGDEAMTVGPALTMLPGSSPSSEKTSGPGAAGVTGAKSATPVSGTLTVRARQVSVGRRGETTLKLACAGSAGCRGKVTLSLRGTVRVKGKKVRRAVTIGKSAVLEIAAGRRDTVRIRLDARGRSVLRADHGRLTVEMTLATPGHKRVRSLQLIERAQPGS